ncbi:hypothetical protein M2323_004318 [Rhodoblastus acidophilus]|uniref:hypothetical protein n=1 Tax=Rhodoblastus acidophilus TaxID=1074 RepID=UPI0022240EFD|nr:hypothetical protein [Rhodoblastus acidophilus]MCW2286521.1 hypothetical protein [Rhodoblastus acidophilus]MCW2335370.1 hypothetical protein [Rhodoblastus acidophilus]
MLSPPPPVYEAYETSPSALDRFCAFGIFSVFAVVFAYEPLMWVDQHTFSILGYILYPLEWTVNKILFPEAITPFRGNVGALLVGLLCAGVIAFAVAAIGLVLGALGWAFRGAAIVHTCCSAVADFARGIYRARIAMPPKRASR